MLDVKLITHAVSDESDTLSLPRIVTTRMRVWGAMKVIRNAAWLWGARGLADVSSFLLFAVISRSFGSAGTGQYSYAFAVGNLVALIGSSGLEEYGIREYASATPDARPRLWREIASSQLVQLAL